MVSKMCSERKSSRPCLSEGSGIMPLSWRKGSNIQGGTLDLRKSPQSSPFVFVKKKGDMKNRPTQDYRKLNNSTRKNQYLLPMIGELVNGLKKRKVLLKIDIWWGYNNVRIKEGDEWKAMFHTTRGLFEPTVMLFGLCNSPETFQAFMNDIFAELIREGLVKVYIDDILVSTDTMEEHWETN
jgi:hypothetical protein